MRRAYFRCTISGSSCRSACTWVNASFNGREGIRQVHSLTSLQSGARDADMLQAIASGVQIREQPRSRDSRGERLIDRALVWNLQDFFLPDSTPAHFSLAHHLRLGEPQLSISKFGQHRTIMSYH
jgi:hypothetical protein